MANNRNEIISIWMNLFSGHYQTSKLINPLIKIDETFIEQFFEKILDQYGDGVSVSEEEKEDIIRKIKASYSIHQEEGCAIVGDYDHDFDWYKKLKQSKEYSDYYWGRYKGHLINKQFPEGIINRLENTTLEKVMSYIGNPKEETLYSIRGLVVGDVQSGKTSNYIGLISKAADAGYKVIFLLTGTIESLRRQTQIRVEEGFIGYDSVNAVDVGVGRGEKTPKAFTSREKDFVGSNDQNTTYKISSNSEPMIFVIKKNVSVLKKIYASLKNINTNQFNQKIDAPMIMIDDEADNASINTNKPENDPTKINNYIRKILALFSRNSYVGFTATPFANVFISYDTDNEMLADDLFPKDFIYALESPSNYCGARKYFFEKNNNIEFIQDANNDIFPMSHKKDWQGDYLFGSFYKSINTFLLVNALRDKREVLKNTHRSMLINVSRFTNVQMVIRDIVEEYFGLVKRTIKQTYKSRKEDYLKNPIIKKLYDLYNSDFANLEYYGKRYTWEDVFAVLYDSIKDIQIAVVNSSKNSTKLNYDDHKKDGLRVIAIGGLALSRGLTLEGLCVSYFYRNTATFDVLMQMGRWFGYRDDYADVCKIWLTKASFEYYKEISESTENLKKDIRKMGEQNKRPQDYGIRVRNNSSALGITAANKMRSTKKKIIRKSFYGNVFETPYLYRRMDYMRSNIEKSIEFLSGLNEKQKDCSVKHPYFNDVEKSKIIALLKVLHIHEANENFDTRQLVEFIKNEGSYDNFDVLVMGGDSKLTFNINSIIQDKCVDRQYDIVNKGTDKNDEIIRMSKQRAHLWGPRDTSFGLDPQTIKNINNTFNSISAQDYMIEGRNPLLIIYFINPKNTDQTEEEIHTLNQSVKEQISDIVELSLDLAKEKNKFLVGYAIGFPKKQGSISNGAVHYVVNRTCSYYDKQHDEDMQMYGEEI